MHLISDELWISREERTVKSFGGMLAHFEALVRLLLVAVLVLVDRVEQVAHQLAVDLEHGERHLHAALVAALPPVLDRLEDLFAEAWHDALVRAVANNRVRLAGACLGR